MFIGFNFRGVTSLMITSQWNSERKDPQYYIHKAEAYEQQGSFRKAYEELTRMTTYYPSLPQVNSVIFLLFCIDKLTINL